MNLAICKKKKCNLIIFELYIINFKAINVDSKNWHLYCISIVFTELSILIVWEN